MTPPRAARAFSIMLLGVSLNAWQRSDSPHPQFSWRGDVDGVVTLYIRAGVNRLQVETREGAPVQHERYRLFDRLPDTEQQVRLEVIEGRGSVHITQQPGVENGYTVAVAIEDRQDGVGHYSLALHWDTSGNQFTRGKWRDLGWQGDGAAHVPESVTARVTWRGRVDEEAVVECRGSSCRASAEKGLPVSHEQFQFTAPLPAQPVQVTLDAPLNTSAVRLIEQPAASNGNAVRVRISNGCDGARQCRFVLSWPAPGSANEAGIPASRGMRWSGRVAGTVRVTLRGSSAMSQGLDGGRVTDQQVSFDRPVPQRSDPAFVVRKVQGRGDVQIVEPPSEKNGYSLIFEVRNGPDAADDYAVELVW